MVILFGVVSCIYISFLFQSKSVKAINPFNKVFNFRFIGEETNSEQETIPELTDAPTWIIDPIDGTTNFVHGFHLTCISIALSIEKEVVIGIIYNPILGDMFTAIKGKGAYHNNKRIYTSKCEGMCNFFILSLSEKLYFNQDLHYCTCVTKTIENKPLERKNTEVWISQK